MSYPKSMGKLLLGVWVAVVMVLLFYLDSLFQTMKWSMHGYSSSRRMRVNVIHLGTEEFDHIYRQQNHSFGNQPGDFTRTLEKKTVNLPEISDILTHLKNKPNVFEPSFKISKHRSNVTIVFGIPHVNRRVAFYLNDTLKSMMGNIYPEESRHCLIIVLFCDMDHDYNVRMAKATAEAFSKEVQSGLLELITTSKQLYPDLKKLAITARRNGDSLERWIWRSKENIDAAFLMHYAYPKGQFYVMTEDDVVTVRGYVSKIKGFATHPPRQNWYIMGFSEFGSIGILFRSRDCPLFVSFIFSFYGAWSVDLLIDDFLVVMTCNKDIDANCFKNKNTLRLDFHEHLFKHIGYYSSLKGKVMEDARKIIH